MLYRCLPSDQQIRISTTFNFHKAMATGILKLGYFIPNFKILQSHDNRPGKCTLDKREWSAAILT